jgi:hypothetical protein
MELNGDGYQNRIAIPMMVDISTWVKKKYKNGKTVVTHVAM